MLGQYAKSMLAHVVKIVEYKTAQSGLESQKWLKVAKILGTITMFL